MLYFLILLTAFFSILPPPLSVLAQTLMSSVVYSSLGHGGSDGLHAYVHSLDDAVSDMVCSGNTRILYNTILDERDYDLCLYYVF